MRTYLFSFRCIFQSWNRCAKMKFYVVQQQHNFLFDHQKWWLHAKFQHPKSILSGEIVIFWFKIKIPIPPQKSCIGPYSPAGCLRPKFLTPMGIPWALISNPIINRILIFWRPIHISESSQSYSLKYALVFVWLFIFVSLIIIETLLIGTFYGIFEQNIVCEQK